MWFGATMAGRRDKYAIKFVLQVLIKSEKATSVYLECGLGCFHGPFLKV